MSMPYIDASYYQHDLDRQALAELQSNPGFVALSKAFKQVFDERAHFIASKLTHVEITPHQLSEYYEMVPPICEKLGIEIPALFLANSSEIKAYAMNGTMPMIVMNSGVLLNCSEDTIRAMFAHECGHIASGHVVYQTLGKLIADGTSAVLFGPGDHASVALKAAYLKWNRASELTADRAAAIAIGDSSVIGNMCLELAGSWECFDSQVFGDLFMQQSSEYARIVEDNSNSDIFEIILHSLEGTPSFNAYRAFEIKRWGATDDFENIQRFLRGEQVVLPEKLSEQSSTRTPEQVPSSVENVQPTEDDASSSATGKTMYFCTNCGYPVEEDQLYCDECGYKCD